MDQGYTAVLSFYWTEKNFLSPKIVDKRFPTCPIYCFSSNLMLTDSLNEDRR